MSLITVKSLEALIQQLRDAARIRFPELDTSFSSIENELLFVIHAYAGRIFMEELSNIINQIDITTLTENRLEEEAKKYGLERMVGKKARGFATFFTTITPPLLGWTIPKNTRIGTRSGLVQFSYYTTEEVIMYASDFMTDTNRYEKTVPIEAEEPGQDYNIGPGIIGVILTPVNNIQGVTNYDFITGGTNEESDDELREALIKRMIGRNIGSTEGIEVRTERQFDLVDAKMLIPGDPEAERLTGTDLFVIYEVENQILNESFTYDGVSPKEFVLSKQPVVKITEVRKNGTPLIPGIDFTLEKDNSATRESIYAKDYVKIIVPLTGGDVIEVDYTYSKIEDIQAYIDKRENQIPSANVWIKRGRRFNVDITLKVGFIGNVVIADEQTRIINALTLYLEGFDLSEDLDESDIISTVQKGFSEIVINSVDYVIISSLSAKDEYGNIITPVSGRINVNKKQYLRLGTVIFI